MKNLLNELRQYKYAPRGEDLGIDDHSTDALRYAFMAGITKREPRNPWCWLKILLLVASIIALLILIF